MKIDSKGRPVLTGGPEWAGVLEAIVDGDDLLCLDVRATWFAGGVDKEDNSVGHVGGEEIDTSDPNLMGCSLPQPSARGCKSPPIPNLPARIPVHVYCRQTGGECDVELVDTGPSAPPRAHAGIDLCRGAWYAMGANPDGADIDVDFRVIGGAKYLSDEVKAAIAQLAPPADDPTVVAETSRRRQVYATTMHQQLHDLYQGAATLGVDDVTAALNQVNDALVSAGAKAA